MNYVLGFAFFHEQVVLIRKNKPDWQKGKLNGVGGKIEAYDAGAISAMRREFEEETGVYVNLDRWFHVARLTASNKFDVIVFKTELMPQEAKLIKTVTDEEIVWASINPLPDDVILNLRWLIPLCGEVNLIPPVLYFLER